MGRASGQAIDERREMPDGAGPTRPGARPGGGLGLSLEPGQVDGPEDRRRDGRGGTRTRHSIQERSRGLLLLDAGVRCESPRQVHDGGRDARPDHGLRGHAVEQPGTEGLEVGGTLGARGGGREHDGHDGGAALVASRGHSREVGLEVQADVLPIGPGQTIRLVEDHHLAGESGEPFAQEVVVERRVVVLLGVSHPRHGIDPGQDGLDPGAMLRGDRVHVGEVQDGDRPEVGRAVLADVVDADPGQQRPECGPLGGGHPGDRRAGRRAPRRRCTDRAAGQPVEQARLADPGAADEGQHVRVAREAHPGDGVGVGRPNGGRRQTQHVGRIGRLQQVCQARR